MTDDIYQIPSTTPDLRTELAEQLSELVPEAITDGKVDVDKLKELLDGDVADSSERFGLFWPGKKRAMRAAQEPTTATLKPDLENSKDWNSTQNVFIEGDNLEVLKVLQRHYHGKIKMIYIDPPYNTGKDFVYPDNFKEGLATYLEWTKQVNDEGKKLSSNSEAEGRFHSNWLNMMYPRLKLARNLLASDGVAFISIGAHELSSLTRIASDVFGEDNILGILTRVAKTTSDSGDYFAPSVDYIISVARQKTLLEGFKMPLSENDIKAYNREDHRGKYKTVGFYQASLTLARSRNARYYIDAPDGSKVIPPENKRWRTIRSTYDGFLENDEIVFLEVGNSPLIDENGKQSKWNVYTKQYLDRRLSEGRTPRDLIDGFPNVLGTKELKELGIPFDFPKPSALVSFLAKISTRSRKDATVLDFFSGSGTTAHAIMQLNAEDGGNRRHIQVQLPEPTPVDSEARKTGFSTLAEISRERIRRAGGKIKQEFAEEISKRETPSMSASALSNSQILISPSGKYRATSQ